MITQWWSRKLSRTGCQEIIEAYLAPEETKDNMHIDNEIVP